MKKDGGKSYLNTGTWSKKVARNTRNFGEVIIVGDSSNENYKYIPKEYFIPEDVDYFHCTSNNTIFGTQIKDFPKVPSLMVCDMSSDIFSRKIDVSKFDLIYVISKKTWDLLELHLLLLKMRFLEKQIGKFLLC